MSVFNFVCTGDKKFSRGFTLTGRKLHVDGIKYMVAIQHYLCHAGNKEMFLSCVVLFVYLFNHSHQSIFINECLM